MESGGGRWLGKGGGSPGTGDGFFRGQQMRCGVRVAWGGRSGARGGGVCGVALWRRRGRVGGRCGGRACFRASH